MFYKEFGDKDAHSIVFLHSAIFVDVFYRLYRMQHDYHIIVPHINGNGEEIKAEYSHTNAALDINCFIQSFLNKKVTAVGNELGSDLLLQIAIKSPRYFDKLVLINPTLLCSQEEKNKQSKKNTLNKCRTFTCLKGRLNGLRGSVLNDYVEYAVNMSKENVKSMFKINPLCYDILESISLLNIPTLIVYGDENRAVTMTSELLNKLIPNSIIKIIKGKDIAITKSGEIQRLITEFIEDNG
ncbi:MAG: hypothetical protein RR054_04210 [Clostridia bacterium]